MIREKGGFVRIQRNTLDPPLRPNTNTADASAFLLERMESYRFSAYYQELDNAANEGALPRMKVVCLFGQMTHARLRGAESLYSID